MYSFAFHVLSPTQVRFKHRAKPPTRDRRQRFRNNHIRRRLIRSAISTDSDLSTEFSSDYSEFVVDLKPPYGFALGPDDLGQIYVASVVPGSSAEKQKVVVGDIFKQCTCALQPDEVCAYSDLRKIQWAIRKNSKQLRLVLKRQQTMGRMRWHPCGVCGCISGYSNWLLSPLHFPPQSYTEWSNRREGKVMTTTFHKAIIHEDSPSLREKCDASRMVKAVDLRSRLLDALQLPTLVLPKYSLVHPSSLDEEDEEKCYVDILDDEALSTFEQSRVEEQLNSKKLIPILPWLQVTTGRLAQPDILELASQCALQCLLELRLHCCDHGVALAGVPCQRNDPVLGLILATATLHRLVVRRKAMMRQDIHSCNVLLHCEEEMTSDVGTLLAAYYYWFGMIDIDEAIILAEMALTTTISKELLHQASNFLCHQAAERNQSVTVLWPYGGNHVQVAGELVGGWDQRAVLQQAPLTFSSCFNVPPAAHYLRVHGLLPGTYHYKFIVDNRWTIDRHAPTDADRSGNWNNVLTVKERSVEKRQFQKDLCRTFAALIALRIKHASRNLS